MPLQYWSVYSTTVRTSCTIKLRVRVDINFMSLPWNQSQQQFSCSYCLSDQHYEDR